MAVSKIVTPYYTYDFEFNENGEIIDPISLGITDYTDERELYLINSSFDWDTANDWVKANVRPQLYDYAPISGHIIELPKHEMGGVIYDWLREDGFTKRKLIGYYSEYDHVCLSQRYGAMINLPKGMPMWTRNLKQWADDLGDPRFPEQGKGTHNALADARWNKFVYRWLMENFNHPAWSEEYAKSN